MNMRQVRVVRGPSEWARFPVLDVLVDRNEPPQTGPMLDALRRGLPSLGHQTCNLHPLGFRPFLDQGTDPAHLLEHLTRELQALAGMPMLPGWTEATAEPGVCRIVVAVEDIRLGEGCLQAAGRICQALLAGQSVDLIAEIRDLLELADRICLGPTLRGLLAACRSRNIPVHRFPDTRLLQLGHGSQQRRVRRSETSRTQAIARNLSEDKDLTNELLRQVGVPVPRGRVATSAADAWQAAQEIGVPVVVKPKESSQGRSVFTGLRQQAEIETAFGHAEKEGGQVLVEQFIPGLEHRLLVVAGKVIAATRGDPAWVVGDGRQTVCQLIDSQINTDPRRGDYAAFPLDPITIDPIVTLLLEQQGYGPDAVVPAGERVLIRRNGNLATDDTDRVHPEVAARAADAARIIGLDVAGIDVVAEDIGRPLEEQGGAIVDVNAGPGLQMHMQPARGQPRPVTEAILASLLPVPQTGRIPIIGIVGGPDAEQISAVLARLLRNRFGRIARITARGWFLNERCSRYGDFRDPHGAAHLLLHPDVDAAVIELARRGRLEEGCGFDVCDVAILTGQPATNEDLSRSLLKALAPSGLAILTADNPVVVELAPPEAERTLLVTCHPSSAVSPLSVHGRLAHVQDRAVVIVEGDRPVEVLALDRFPDIQEDLRTSPPTAWLPALLAAQFVCERFPAVTPGPRESPDHR